jgi:hypothetical protein
MIKNSRPIPHEISFGKVASMNFKTFFVTMPSLGRVIKIIEEEGELMEIS